MQVAQGIGHEVSDLVVFQHTPNNALHIRQRTNDSKDRQTKGDGEKIILKVFRTSGELLFLILNLTQMPVLQKIVHLRKLEKSSMVVGRREDQLLLEALETFCRSRIK